MNTAHQIVSQLLEGDDPKQELSRLLLSGFQLRIKSKSLGNRLTTYEYKILFGGIPIFGAQTFNEAWAERRGGNMVLAMRELNDKDPITSERKAQAWFHKHLVEIYDRVEELES